MAEKTNSVTILVVKVFNDSILKTIASARKPVGSLYTLLMAEILVFYFFSCYVLTKPGKKKEDQKDHKRNFGKGVFHMVPRRQEKLLRAYAHNTLLRTPAELKH